MAIKEFITLEGVQEVEAQLKKLAATGEQSLEQFRKPLPDMKLPDIDSKPIEETTGHVVKLTEVLHTLRPILQAAGLQFSEFGALTRLAGTSLIALGAAVTGAGAIGLGKLEEAVALAKAQLADLIGSTAGGEAAFNRLQQSAKAFGTTAQALQPAFAALKRGLDDFAQSSQGFKFVAFKPEDLPGAQNLDNISKATDNFFKILRAGRLDSTEAAKASTDFFNAVAKGGTLTADILKTLPVGTIQLLAQAMGRGLVSVSQFTAEVAKTPITITKLTEALARFGPQADQAFDSKAIITMSDAFNKLLGTFSDFAKGVTGLTISEGIVKQLEIFRQGFVDTIAQIDAFITKAKEVGAIKVLGIPLLTIEFDKSKTEAEAEKTGLESAEAFKKGFRTAPKEKIDVKDIITFDPGSTAENFFNIKPVVPAEGQQALVEQFRQTGEQAGAALQQGAQQTPVDFSNWLQALTSFGSQAVSLVQSIYQQMAAAFSQPIPVNFDVRSPLGSTAPFASGGMVRGPGSTTSDSILAWLSNQEFVVNARAVSHYGPDLFAALNAMRLPRDFVSRFAMGGLARSISGNRFAAGGQVRSGNPVVLKIDRQSFNMTAGDDTIAQLKRFAVASQLSSTGRKPRWVK